MQSLAAISAHTSALFLDFDGTLADLASQPEAVEVPNDLVVLLGRLYQLLGGAVALISGRRLVDLDNFLAPLTLPAAAEHGAQRRRAGGEVIGVTPPDLATVMAAAQSLSAGHAGLRVEIKSSSIALHYRHAPALEGLCLAVMHDAVSRTPGVEVLHGKCVVEVKPMGVNKGRAIAAFMAEAPFAGRVPLFAGDDTTDEAGFLLVQSQGGYGLKVGVGPTAALHRCDSPAQLRAWLASGLGATPELAARSSHVVSQGAA